MNPIVASSAVDRYGVRPPSTMFASSAAPLNVSATRRNSSRLSGLSTNKMSAPASRNFSARRSAASIPSEYRASVRATIMKSLLGRESTATRILSTASSIGMTRRNSVCPHFFGNSWSSIWMPAAPAAAYPRTVRSVFSNPPYPVSPSAIKGTLMTDAIIRTRSSISVYDATPASATPSAEATAPYPVMYSASNPIRSAIRAEMPSNTPGSMRHPGRASRVRIETASLMVSSSVIPPQTTPAASDVTPAAQDKNS